MPVAAIVLSRALDEDSLARLRGYGLDIDDAPVGGAHAGPAGGDLADALTLSTGRRALVVVAPRGADGPDRVQQIAAARASSATGDVEPLSLVILPASLTPQPGPVAVLSPAGAASAYEIYVGAALGAASARRVEHLNGRGTLGSAVHSGVAGRLIARGAAPSWRETPHARPERALHTLGSRPAVIVVPDGVEPADAGRIVADHPDADVVLVFDRARARYGAQVAERVATMIELAFSLSATGDPIVDVDPQPETLLTRVAEPEPDLPQIRASDVIHVRLTSEALELTNRTRQRLRLRVSLADRKDAGVARAQFQTDLAADSTTSTPTTSVPGLEDLAPPVAVMRHWSHESEEVYEGGEQCISLFRVSVLDAAGDVRAERDYRPGNGLDYFVTARDLAALLGRPVARSVLPEPSTRVEANTHKGDLLGALAAAVRLGAGALDARGT